MPGQLTRAAFLATAGAIAFAPSALAVPGDLDPAWLRLLTTLELLLVDFYGRMLKRSRLRATGRDAARRALYSFGTPLAIEDASGALGAFTS